MCLDIHLNIVSGSTSKESFRNFMPRWSFGTCKGIDYDHVVTNYPFPANFTERCCLTPGLHTLMCYSNPPARGWRYWHMSIDGHQYCNDFGTYTSFQKIAVTSMYFGLLINRAILLSGHSQIYYIYHIFSLKGMPLQLKPSKIICQNITLSQTLVKFIN